MKRQLRRQERLIDIENNFQSHVDFENEYPNQNNNCKYNK